MSRLAGGVKSVPQIFLNDKHLPGGNSHLQELEKEGKLDEILAAGLKDPPGSNVPVVTLPKLSPKLKEELAPLGIGGLIKDSEEESTIRSVFNLMRTSKQFKNKFQGKDFVSFLLHHNQSTEFGVRMIELGIIKAIGQKSADLKNSLFILTCNENEYVLNMTFDVTVSNLKGRRTAEEISYSMRSHILSLHQKFLSLNGSSVDYIGIRKSKEFETYVDIATELQLIDMKEFPKLTENVKKAFFINLYNALAIHAFVIFGHAPTSIGRLKFFNSVSYKLGGQIWSLNAIEHGALRGNRPTPAGFFPFFRGSMFSSLPLFANHGDDRLLCSMKQVDPRIHFALNCGAKSCPPVKLFSGENLDSELQLAAQSFCEGEENVKIEENKVTLSMILKWYSIDFGKNDIEVLTTVSKYLEGEELEKMKKLLNNKGKFSVQYFPYDW
jgi:hypothetical protein